MTRALVVALSVSALVGSLWLPRAPTAGDTSSAAEARATAAAITLRGRPGAPGAWQQRLSAEARSSCG